MAYIRLSQIGLLEVSIIKTYQTYKVAKLVTALIVVFSFISLSGCFFRPVNNTPENTPETTPSEAQEQPTVDRDNTVEPDSSDNGGLDHSLINNNSSEISNDVPGTLSQEAKELIGQWASHNYGQINGQSTSDDELITFQNNGIFSDVIVTAGPLMNGTLKTQGKFKVEGDIIFFYDCKESWEPEPDTSTKKQAYENKTIEDYEGQFELIDDSTFSMSYMTYEKID